MNIIISCYRAALFLKLVLVVCAVGTSIYTLKHKNEDNYPDYEIDDDRRPVKQLSIFKSLYRQSAIHLQPELPNTMNTQAKYTVKDLLSPDMFSQSDPAFYLLEKIRKLTSEEKFSIGHRLANRIYRYNIPIPPSDIPYAELSRAIILCLYKLAATKITIINIQSTLSSGHVPLPTVLLSSELSKFFLYDIFSDQYPPANLMIKLMNTPKDKIMNLRIQLQDLMKNNELPEQYFRYVRELYTFTMNDSAIKILQEISERREKLRNSSLAHDQQPANSFQQGNNANNLSSGSGTGFAAQSTLSQSTSSDDDTFRGNTQLV